MARFARTSLFGSDAASPGGANGHPRGYPPARWSRQASAGMGRGVTCRRGRLWGARRSCGRRPWPGPSGPARWTPCRRRTSRPLHRLSRPSVGIRSRAPGSSTLGCGASAASSCARRPPRRRPPPRRGTGFVGRNLLGTGLHPTNPVPRWRTGAHSRTTAGPRRRGDAGARCRGSTGDRGTGRPRGSAGPRGRTTAGAREGDGYGEVRHRNDSRRRMDGDRVPRAAFDETTSTLISRAEVAEIPSPRVIARAVMLRSVILRVGGGHAAQSGDVSGILCARPAHRLRLRDPAERPASAVRLSARPARPARH